MIHSSERVKHQCIHTIPSSIQLYSFGPFCTLYQVSVYAQSGFFVAANATPGDQLPSLYLNIWLLARHQRVCLVFYMLSFLTYGDTMERLRMTQVGTKSVDSNGSQKHKTICLLQWLGNEQLFCLVSFFLKLFCSASLRIVFRRVTMFVCSNRARFESSITFEPVCG